MFQAIKKTGFWGGLKLSNHSAEEKIKERIMESFGGKHDCSIRSLLLVMPELDHEEVKNAFMHCTQWHPYGAVTNKEFNMALKFLKIYHKFEYGEPDNSNAWDFIDDGENTYIILFYGHYTVVDKGRIVDFFPIRISDDRKVHCYWKIEGRKEE